MAEYIDKEAATALAPLPKELREYQTANLDDAFEYGYDFAIGQIDAIPAADVKPVVRGKWIPHYDYAEFVDGNTLSAMPRIFQDGWQCSLCGWYMMSQSNFCPNCGADMREES